MGHEIAVINASKVPRRDLAFQVEAVNIQMREHFIPAWSSEQWAKVGLSYRLPDGDIPWIVAYYESANDLPPDQFWPLTVEDTVPDGLLGAHDDYGGLISAFELGNPGAPLDATVLSHEATEMRGDPTTSILIPSGHPGFDIAAESADPVEGDAYEIETDLMGERRQILVSNFVLPAWFVPGAPGPYDFMGRCTAPQQVRPGGYYIARDNGKVHEVWAMREGREKIAAKRGNPRSRTARRIAAIEPPVPQARDAEDPRA